MKSASFSNAMRNYIVYTVLVLCCLAISCGVAGHYVQSTSSMSPNIEIGDHFTTIEISNAVLNPIERFDVIVYKPQPSKINIGSTENVRIAHRVVGMSNEKIEIKKGEIYINEKLLNQPFEKIVGGIDFPPIQIPENEYFLLGDNRPESLDSRHWNKPTIRREDIYGKINTVIHKEDWDKGKRW